MAQKKKAPANGKGGIDRWTSNGVSVRNTTQTSAYKKQVAELKKELAKGKK